jgi:hypothetical protein
MSLLPCSALKHPKVGRDLRVLLAQWRFFKGLSGLLGI